MGYRKNKVNRTSLKVNEGYEGETIEQKIDRILNNKEPISDGAPLIYTERKDGVRPEHDIRTDRFEVALDATTHIDKAHKAKREARILEMNKDNKAEKHGTEGGDGKPESTQGK